MPAVSFSSIQAVPSTVLFIILSLIGVFALVQGTTVFLQEKRRLGKSPLPGYYLSYCALSACLALWHLGYAHVSIAGSVAEAWFWWRISAPGFCLYQPILLHFFLGITNPGNRLPRKVWLIYLPGLFFMGLSWTGPLIVDSFHFTSLGWVEFSDLGSPLYYVFMGYVFLYLGVAFLVARRAARRSASNRERRQLLALYRVGLLILAAGFVTLMVKNLFYPRMPMLVNAISVLWLIAFVIVRHRFRFMDTSIAGLHRYILARIRELVLFIAPDGRIVHANDTALEMVGQESLVGVSAEAVIRGYQAIEEASRSGDNHQYNDGELLLFTADGEELPLLCYTTRLMDRFGDWLGVLIVGTPLRGLDAGADGYGLTRQER